MVPYITRHHKVQRSLKPIIRNKIANSHGPMITVFEICIHHKNILFIYNAKLRVPPQNIDGD